jgi:hypothetical protein
MLWRNRAATSASTASLRNIKNICHRRDRSVLRIQVADCFAVVLDKVFHRSPVFSEGLVFRVLHNSNVHVPKEKIRALLYDKLGIFGDGIVKLDQILDADIVGLISGSSRQYSMHVRLDKDQ